MLKDYLVFGKPNFGNDEIEAITRVINSGWVGMGAETLQFEKELAEYIGAPNVVTVNSCTSALFLSLLSLGIKEGDEVICPSLTWCATANAALYLGAKPVFCDVDIDTMCVTPESINNVLTKNTRAVIVVHFGGYPVDVDAIRASIPAGVAIIEDAAHALGSRFENGKMVGASGNLTCFSFYANKNLSTGEGGAISLVNDEVAEQLRILRQNGMQSNAWSRFTEPNTRVSPYVQVLGYKMNYTDLQACIGRIQLKRQAEFQKCRYDISKIYYEAAEELKLPVQEMVIHSNHSRHLFIIVLPTELYEINRYELLKELWKLNIGATIHYVPLHLMPFYTEFAGVELKTTENIGERILTLPISASMAIDDAKVVAGNLRDILKSRIAN